MNLDEALTFSGQKCIFRGEPHAVSRPHVSLAAYALLTVLLVLLLLAAACTAAPAAPAPAASQGISAQNVWARPAKMMGSMPMEGDAQQMQHGGANSAVYMVLANGGATADRLVSRAG